MKRFFLLTLILVLGAGCAWGAAGKTYKLQSPSGELAIEINAGAETIWAVSMNGTRVLEPSALSMTLDDGTVFGRDVKVKKAVKGKERRTGW